MTMNTAPASPKHIYVVLGMARSGTSAITKGLEALGIDLGNHLMPAESQFNPKGVYEDIDVAYKINRAVAYSLGYTWESLHLMNHLCQNNPKLDKLAVEAQTVLEQRFANKTHWAFKDPRTCKILSFWQSVFKKQNLAEHYVIAVRHPLASAYSWHNLNEVDVEAALLSWLSHTLSAIDGTENKNRVIVSYDLMLQAPRHELQRIKTSLDIQIPADAAKLDAYANNFLDKKLKHHEYLNETKSHPVLAIAPICLNVYELLMKLARDEMAPDSESFRAAWNDIKKEFETVYPIYCYVDALIKKNKEQERHIRSIQKSLPWKLIYPLRFIDNLLRSKRNKQKDKQRLSA
ncbi:MAG: hypothetical protein P4M14_08880 [Gammaproteobacteria bacterium]|nr:hypothetical protein [Gammaproteobacteria bacterium]